jgi:hypothetical protein
VIWPSHLETFGPVGIILKPRSTASVTSICDKDSGSSVDKETGKRGSMGSPFSKEAVLYTFANATGYNEWNVENAETVGIFVHPTDPLDVARSCNLTDVPGYDPLIAELMGEDAVVGAVRLTLAGVMADFPTLPIYSISDENIVRMELGDNGAKFIVVDPADIYC